MKKEQITVIMADEGMYLTQPANVDFTERVIASSVALGCHDSADNWREIDADEARAIKTELEKCRAERTLLRCGNLI